MPSYDIKHQEPPRGEGVMKFLCAQSPEQAVASYERIMARPVQTVYIWEKDGGYYYACKGAV